MLDKDGSVLQQLSLVLLDIILVLRCWFTVNVANTKKQDNAYSLVLGGVIYCCVDLTAISRTQLVLWIQLSSMSLSL